jgi:hypothetical protein
MSDTANPAGIETEVLCRPGENGWFCEVVVRDESSESRHRVSVPSSDLDRLAPGSSDATELVRTTFAFLLEREPKESILPEFGLREVSRYFPEFEEQMRAEVATAEVAERESESAEERVD